MKQPGNVCERPTARSTGPVAACIRVVETEYRGQPGQDLLAIHRRAASAPALASGSIELVCQITESTGVVAYKPIAWARDRSRRATRYAMLDLRERATRSTGSPRATTLWRRRERRRAGRGPSLEPAHLRLRLLAQVQAPGQVLRGRARGRIRFDPSAAGDGSRRSSAARASARSARSRATRHASGRASRSRS